MQFAVCRFCKKRIYRESGWPEPGWLHYGSELLFCRRARRNTEEVATPVPGSEREEPL